MRLEAKRYLYDIQHAVTLLEKFVAGKTLADYQHDAMLRAAVERKFEVVGEAMARLAKLGESLASLISEHQRIRIIAFRNVLVHGYADVDDQLVWDIVETRLTTLRHEVEELLGHSPAEAP